MSEVVLWHILTNTPVADPESEESGAPALGRGKGAGQFLLNLGQYKGLSKVFDE